jgi:methanogenic corrinoid protein MtbC1
MPDQAIRQAIDARREALAEAIVARYYDLDPESWRAHGEAGRARCVQDAGYHLMYLGEAIGASSPAIFIDYVDWLRVLFAGLGFPVDSVALTLECMRHVIRRELPQEQSAVAVEFLALAAAHVDQTPVASAPLIQPSRPLADLASRYLDALLRGDRRAAVELIVGAARDGVPVRDIYLDVFQVSQHEIGRLWQTNQISVAQEHYCTAATQLAMAQLYPYVFSTEKTGRRLIVACVSGELHEIGPRILADLFELEGWDTYYLGANTPPVAVLRAVQQRKPHLLAVSATMAFHVSAVADMVACVRGGGSTQPHIMVGGYPFNVAPDLWQRVGADGSAPDALEAIAVANQLVGRAEN